MTKVKKISKVAMSRQSQIREEVYSILKGEAYKVFTLENSRDNSIGERLSALEKSGMPEGALEEIKLAISQLRYKQNQQQRAMEGLLQFFNITKDFFTEPKQPTP